jgi:hypothetical protein
MSPGIDSKESILPAYVPSRQSSIFYRLWSPGIDSKASIPPAYVVWRAGIPTRCLDPIDFLKNSSSGYKGWRNRSLESIPGIFKRLQIRALAMLSSSHSCPTINQITTSNGKHIS